ncbi:MAG: phosphatidylinositol kinase [Acidimicrobiaceae bacterium]|nr:phosphatidylinositol kinase [Acidimicrobiaceae bacterium]|tara:strand:- start:227 stop:967 length:741 start_codon:yes stop_codon:yes gene_type:complete
MVIQENPFRDREPVSKKKALATLQNGKLEVVGRMPWSSNATFLIDVFYEGEVLQGIYKPLKGERPLWDFPEGLYYREVASFELSNLLGWDIVPPTIIRDGPLGDGSIQLFIPCDLSINYFDILEDEANHGSLMKVCIFDFVANSTDRKGGHCLLDPQGKVWAIDNGLTFHTEFKLRTVIWDWAGEPIPQSILDDLEIVLSSPLPNIFATYLDELEAEAIRERAQLLVRAGKFPVDSSGRRYPWPVI